MIRQNIAGWCQQTFENKNLSFHSWWRGWDRIQTTFEKKFNLRHPLVHLCMLTAASRRIEACCSLVQADDGGYVRQLVRQTLSKRGEIVMMPKMARICGNFTKRPPSWSPCRCDLQWVSNLFWRGILIFMFISSLDISSHFIKDHLTANISVERHFLLFLFFIFCVL